MVDSDMRGIRVPASGAVAPASGWSPWQTLDLGGPLSPAVLGEILDGGQAFRWTCLEDGTRLGVFDRTVVRLTLSSEGVVLWSAPTDRVERTATKLVRYFDCGRDARTLADALPWRSDAHLARCIEAFPGLRILRQPFGETLLGFLCSATKQIVQIKQMLALLARRHGAPLASAPAPKAALPRTVAPAGCNDAPAGQAPAFAAPIPPAPDPNRPAIANRRSGTGSSTTPSHAGNRPIENQESKIENPSVSGQPIQNPQSKIENPPLRALPTWPELARVPEAELRKCLLGFRARYIHHTALFLAENPGWLDETEALPYAAAKERLCALPGVGAKVADCVLLFGAGRLEAFPVDVWIIKAMAERYGLHGWKPTQIAHFGRVHFGPLAGLAQQYLFAFERRTSRTSQPARR